MAIKSGIERLPELTDRYDLKYQWKMNKLGLFFKVLLDRGLAGKTKKRAKGAKNQNNVWQQLLLLQLMD